MRYGDLTRRRMLALTGAATASVAGCLSSEAVIGSNATTGSGAEREAYVVVYHWGFAAFDEEGEELDRIEVAPDTEVTLHVVNDHAHDAFGTLPDPVAAELEGFDALERTRRHVEEGRLPEPEEASVEEVYAETHGHGHGHDDGRDDHHENGRDDHDGHGDHHGGDGHHGHDHDDDHHGHDHGDHHEHDDHGGDHGHTHDGHGECDGHDDHHDGEGHGDSAGGLDHGFMLPAFDIESEVPSDAEEPTTVSFVAEEPGTYEAACSVPCGYYHAHQRADLVEVTADA